MFTKKVKLFNCDFNKFLYEIERYDYEVEELGRDTFLHPNHYKKFFSSCGSSLFVQKIKVKLEENTLSFSFLINHWYLFFQTLVFMIFLFYFTIREAKFTSFTLFLISLFFYFFLLGLVLFIFRSEVARDIKKACVKKRV